MKRIVVLHLINFSDFVESSGESPLRAKIGRKAFLLAFASSCLPCTEDLLGLDDPIVATRARVGPSTHAERAALGSTAILTPKPDPRRTIFARVFGWFERLSWATGRAIGGGARLARWARSLCHMPSSDRLAHRQIHFRRAVIPMIKQLSPSGEATMGLVASRFPHQRTQVSATLRWEF